jgi:serine/arginine repetitive matrix protein 2
MTSITADSSHGRFSRPGFTFGLKSQSESRDRARGSQQDREDNWYIPYTGPYEPPPEPRSSRTRDRDSWGDPIYAGEATVGGAPRVHYDDSPSDREYSSGASEEGRVRGRERARSVSSSHTTSARPIEASQRRNFSTYHSHQPTLSYTTSDGGGVGECPVPHRRQSKDRQASPRASLASIFTFGVRPPTSPVHADRTVISPSKILPFRPNAVSADSAVNKVSSNEHRRTMSGGTASLSTGSRYTAGDQIQSLPSQTTTDEDYYNSYYSTLANVPTKVFGTDSTNPPRSRPFIQSTSASPHPYISVSQEAEQRQSSSTHPQSAPPSSSSYETQPMIPKLTFSETPSNHPNTTYTPLNSSSRGTPRKFIKGSVSTPNFQAVNTRLGGPRRIPKGIERWLSAETWCDALLFPRPRLRLQNESGSGGRAVSPPGSPVVPDPRATQGMESVPSRVLAHSRSLVNMRGSQGGYKPGSPSNLPPTRLNTSSAENADQAGPSNRLQPLRPKSWSSDDLDLPTPVPSLAR